MYLSSGGTVVVGVRAVLVVEGASVVVIVVGRHFPLDKKQPFVQVGSHTRSHFNP